MKMGIGIEAIDDYVARAYSVICKVFLKLLLQFSL